MRRYLPFVLLPVVALLAVVALTFTQAKPDHYQPTASGIELGPAREYRPSPLDIVARVAKGATDAAAGAAGGVPPELANVQPLPQEQALLDLLNGARAEHGLASLEFDPELIGVARTRAAAQLPEGPLSHYDALGQLAFVGLLGEAGVSYSRIGENLARSSTADANVVSRLHQALMNSPSHRANILEPAFSRLAIGMAQAESGRLAFAQIFRAV